MDPNPLLGIFLHMLGGLASGSFYVPYRKVRRWAWESYWLAGGFFSWIIVPWILAFWVTPDLLGVFRQAETKDLMWCYLFGAMWGIGGLTFGLTMRYLGMSLGMAIALGYCAAFGTLMPPIFKGKAAVVEILTSVPGIITLVGIAVCLGGIAVTGLAGMSKEREMSKEQKTAAIKEFNFFKGVLVATFSGIMSAGMSYGLEAGTGIAKLATDQGTPGLFWKLPVLVVVLLGGFTSNFIWCVFLNLKNRTGRDYLNRATPLLNNYLFSALAGTTWYMQFFFYQMGEAKIGPYKFSSWSLHMASIIIFSTIWGIVLLEWKGASRRTEKLLTAGLVILVASMCVIGYGNYLKPEKAPAGVQTAKDKAGVAAPPISTTGPAKPAPEQNQ
jgi:L-rhamnose-H+ transport protein